MTCYSITHSRKIPAASYKSRGNPSAIKLECWIFAQIQWRACLRLGSQSHNVNALYLGKRCILSRKMQHCLFSFLPSDLSRRLTPNLTQHTVGPGRLKQINLSNIDSELHFTEASLFFKEMSLFYSLLQ